MNGHRPFAPVWSGQESAHHVEGVHEMDEWPIPAIRQVRRKRGGEAFGTAFRIENGQTRDVVLDPAKQGALTRSGNATDYQEDGTGVAPGRMCQAGDRRS